MDTVMMIMAYILFGAGILFVAEALLLNIVCWFLPEEVKPGTNWLPVILFIGAAIAKYIAG